MIPSRSRGPVANAAPRAAAPPSGPPAAVRPAAAQPAPAAARAGAKPAPRKAAPATPKARRRPSWPRLRLLPAVIFVAVLLLGVRVAEVVGMIANGPFAMPEIPPARAQQAPAQQAPAPAKPADPAKPAEAKPGPAPEALTPKGSAAGNEDDLPPGAFADAPQVVIERLQQRREKLEAKQKEVEQRMTVLAATEQRIDQKLGELQKLRDQIQGLLRQHDQQRNEQIDSLVKIYETMKPKEAALIFEKLDEKVLLAVVTRMKEAKTAPIMASMDPERAKHITSLLIEQRQLPGEAKTN
ncbi:MAG TPA: hypothetical protein VEH84_01570 [Alphaproteobacteria bacterium]|nr:hypothetical protein [Alphaproteobacteria bacterium]